jgi:hypothetical protein
MSFYANCRPGFRARYTQRIGPWALTEYDEEGEAVIHGYCDGTDTEVLFELQNLTEVGTAGFRAPALHVGLCGLAYRARVCTRELNTRWLPLERAVPSRAAHENDWILRGQVIAFKPLRNPLSGSELYWVYLDLGGLKLEVLVNTRALTGGPLEVGSDAVLRKSGFRGTFLMNRRCGFATRESTAPVPRATSGRVSRELINFDRNAPSPAPHRPFIE